MRLIGSLVGVSHLIWWGGSLLLKRVSKNGKTSKGSSTRVNQRLVLFLSVLSSTTLELRRGAVLVTTCIQSKDNASNE